MKGKLISGRLSIIKELGNSTTSEFVRQICPYASTVKDCNVGCPQFGDVMSGITILTDSGNVLENGTEIKICQGKTLTFSEFSIEK